MKLNIPFYKQTNPLNCGSIALKMVLEFLGKKYSEEELDKLLDLKEGKGLMTIELAIAAKNLGFEVEFYTKHLVMPESHFEHEFYQKHASTDVQGTMELLQISKETGVNLFEKSLSLKEIENKVNKNSIPILILDWDKVQPRTGKYQGHFVPIVGFDDENVYVHEMGKNKTPYFQIKKEVFENARKADGTDEDTLFIIKK